MQIVSDEENQNLWRLWLVWIAVCAFSSVLWLTASTSQYSLWREVAIPEWRQYFALVLLLLALTLPRVLEWAVLKQIAPGLRLPTWFGAMALAGIVWALIVFAALKFGVSSKSWFQPSQFDRLAKIDLHSYRLDTSFGGFFQIRWSSLVASIVITIALVSFVPALVLAWRSKQKIVLFIAAAIVGALSAELGNLYFDFSGYRPTTNSLRALLDKHFIEVVRHGARGALWGGASGFVYVAWMYLRPLGHEAVGLKSQMGRAGALLLFLAGLVLMAPTIAYVLGPHGIRAGFPGLRKLFTAAPKTDHSTGKKILSFSHRSEVPVYKFTWAKLSPDGRSLLANLPDRTPVLLDLATGKQTGTFAKREFRNERQDTIWSPDSRYIVVRSWGAEVAIPKTIYSRHESRIRVFRRDGLKQVSDWQSTGKSCFDSQKSPAVMFAPDSASIWILCGENDQRGSDLVAVRLSFPRLELIGERNNGNSAQFFWLQGLVELDGRIASWHHTKEKLIVRDLLSGTVRYQLDGLTSPELGSNLTFQPGWTTIGSGVAILRYCGFPTDHIPKEDRAAIMAAINRCRVLTFDLGSGSLREAREMNRFGIRHEIQVGSSRYFLRSLHKPTSKIGEIAVIESDTDSIQQKITTVAQTILAVSKNSNYVVSREIDSDYLRFYRTNSPSP